MATAEESIGFGAKMRQVAAGILSLLGVKQALAWLVQKDKLDPGGEKITGWRCIVISQIWALGQNLIALVNIKIACKWVFTPLTLIIIGFDTHHIIWHWSLVNWQLHPEVIRPSDVAPSHHDEAKQCKVHYVIMSVAKKTQFLRWTTIYTISISASF